MDVIKWIFEKIGDGFSWLLEQLGLPSFSEFLVVLVDVGKYVGLIIAMLGFLLMMPQLSFSKKIIKIGFTLILIFGVIEIAFC